MGDRKFYIVDVFAEERYAGNQLAVVVDCDGLGTGQMQSIAREMHFSETTFVLSCHMRDGCWDARIFTPVEEIPFAGHPTLGTAWVIRNEMLGGPAERVVLSLRAGRIPVTFEAQDEGSEVLWMKQLPPEFGDTVDPATIAGVLGLSVEQVDRRFPVQVVSTGLPFVIVPLVDIGAVKQARVDRRRYHELGRDPSMRSIFLFCGAAEDSANQFHARMFAEAFGVPEDPATGSANGCLAGYLVQHRYLGGERIDVRVEQGYEIRRPSLLRLKAERTKDRIDIRVGGRVFLAARGELVC